MKQCLRTLWLLLQILAGFTILAVSLTLWGYLILIAVREMKG